MTDRRDTSHIEAAELVARLGRLAYRPRPDDRLTSAQWAALDYFSRANRFSRTVSSFAAYHATTRGTASQTVKRLVECEYLERTRAEGDGRSWQIDLTAKAESLLEDNPFRDLGQALDSLPTRTCAALVESLSRVVRRLADEGSAEQFGICLSCESLRSPSTTNADVPRWLCSQLQETVEPPDLSRLCVNFKPLTVP